MKFKNKKEEIEKEEKNENAIEIIMGDNSNLEISDVGDCVNELRPKAHITNPKKLVIPKAKKK